jgi:hypothetical protein
MIARTNAEFRRNWFEDTYLWLPMGLLCFDNGVAYDTWVARSGRYLQGWGLWWGEAFPFFILWLHAQFENVALIMARGILRLRDKAISFYRSPQQDAWLFKITWAALDTLLGLLLLPKTEKALKWPFASVLDTYCEVIYSLIFSIRRCHFYNKDCHLVSHLHWQSSYKTRQRKYGISLRCALRDASIKMHHKKCSLFMTTLIHILEWLLTIPEAIFLSTTGAGQIAYLVLRWSTSLWIPYSSQRCFPVETPVEDFISVLHHWPWHSFLPGLQALWTFLSAFSNS